jgi:hypothetical protein
MDDEQASHGGRIIRSGSHGTCVVDWKFLMARTKVVIPTLKANAHCVRKKLFLRPQRTHRLGLSYLCKVIVQTGRAKYSGLHEKKGYRSPGT